MIILGIDPGLRNTGFGVIDASNKNHLNYIASGVIQTNSNEKLYQRIATIVSGIGKVIQTYSPTVVAIEKVFVNVNPSSTLLLGQARGAAIAACTLYDLEVHEYTALQLKQSVVGYGHASKDQLQKMVMHLLRLSGCPQADAADGLGIAITHAQYAPLSKIFNMSSVKKGRITAY